MGDSISFPSPSVSGNVRFFRVATSVQARRKRRRLDGTPDLEQTLNTNDSKSVRGPTYLFTKTNAVHLTCELGEDARCRPPHKALAIGPPAPRRRTRVARRSCFVASLASATAAVLVLAGCGGGNDLQGDTVTTLAAGSPFPAAEDAAVCAGSVTTATACLPAPIAAATDAALTTTIPGEIQ